MTAQKGSIAWIGIGKMGLPIAGRIAGAGYSVTAFDASTERLAMARQSGLSPAGSATEAVSGQSVVFTSLPDDAALRAALLSPPGLLGAMSPGSVLIETSTVSAEISAELAEAARAQGVDYLRAPVIDALRARRLGELGGNLRADCRR